MDTSYNNLCTDAHPVMKRQTISAQSTIDAKILTQVENELEGFEKISILFLIAAENPHTYERVLALYKNIEKQPNVILEFIQNNIELWGPKLIESLCIINNKEIIRNLGFLVENLMMRYHSEIPRYTIHVNAANKVLYKLFESMGIEKVKQLLQCVYQEDKIPQGELKELDYLELHALYWLHVKYITITSDGTDLSNLFRHLKKLDYYAKLIYTDVEYFSTPISQRDSRFEIPALRQCIEMPSQTNEISSDNDPEFSARTINKGMCLIINEVNFMNEYETRDGSDKDRDKLERTFTGMGFDVKITENASKAEIFKLFEKLNNNFDVKTYDCLVVCILSHGDERGVITSDEKAISNYDLENAMCKWNLRDTIKILIIQACRGQILGNKSQSSQLENDLKHSQLASDGPSSRNVLPNRHFVRYMSTMRGYRSVRHKLEGTWFIDALCTVLKRNKKILVSQLSAAVNRIVHAKRGNLTGVKDVTQIPEMTIRLEEEVYFPPYIENPNDCPA